MGVCQRTPHALVLTKALDHGFHVAVLLAGFLEALLVVDECRVGELRFKFFVAVFELFEAVEHVRISSARGAGINVRNGTDEKGRRAVRKGAARQSRGVPRPGGKNSPDCRQRKASQCFDDNATLPMHPAASMLWAVSQQFYRSFRAFMRRGKVRCEPRGVLARPQPRDSVPVRLPARRAAQQPRRQRDHSPHKLKHTAYREAHDAKRQQQQPHDGIQHQRDQRQRPAQHKQNAPQQEFQQRSSPLACRLTPTASPRYARSVPRVPKNRGRRGSWRGWPVETRLGDDAGGEPALSRCVVLRHAERERVRPTSPPAGQSTSTLSRRAHPAAVRRR